MVISCSIGLFVTSLALIRGSRSKLVGHLVTPAKKRATISPWLSVTISYLKTRKFVSMCVGSAWQLRVHSLRASETDGKPEVSASQAQSFRNTAILTVPS